MDQCVSLQSLSVVMNSDTALRYRSKLEETRLFAEIHLSTKMRAN